jgi:hypothetical protein
MVNNKLGKYLDFFLYAFLAIGIAVFVVKQLSKSEIKSFDSYPKTELKFNFDTLINMGKVRPCGCFSTRKPCALVVSRL